VASRQVAPGANRVAARFANSRLTSRRLWWRFLGHGSGKKVQSSASEPSGTRCSIDQTASTAQNLTFAAPTSATRPNPSATPGSHTSSARTLYAGRAAASTAVDSPMPEPISTISGASRPNQRRHSNPGSSTASSGITHRAWYACHAASWVGVKRLPRRE
jgi:hypothetical protein